MIYTEKKDVELVISVKKRLDKNFESILLTAILLLFVFAFQILLGIDVNTSASLSPSPLPTGYTYMSYSPKDIHKGDLILINSQHNYIFHQTQLLSIYENKNDFYLIKDKNVQASPQIIHALNGLTEAFYHSTLIDDLIAISGYRSYEHQQKLFENAEQDLKDGLIWTAPPGASEHHSGLAIDLGIYREEKSYTFKGEGQYSYILSNAYRFGLIYRYPSSKSDITKVYGEPWHLRYVGEAHAQYMFEHNLCLEEYISFLKEHTFSDNPLKVCTYNGFDYEIYYIPEKECSQGIPVPTHLPFKVSGNNMDGFIVTVQTGAK